MEEQTSQTAKARLSITEAAGLAGINRTYFYEKYVTPGLVTIQQDERGKKYIDLPSLLMAV